jgi:hypothetical protein
MVGRPQEGHGFEPSGVQVRLLRLKELGLDMPPASLVRSAVVFQKKEKEEKTLFYLYPADIVNQHLHLYQVKNPKLLWLFLDTIITIMF